ncbi:MAG: hypothetical protein MJZ61_08650 [Bacteroidales bacterium]|nr:hypothetical protein [Bacteroidales bacterium]
MTSLSVPVEISAFMDVDINELTRQLSEYAKVLLPKLSKKKSVKDKKKFEISPETQAFIDSLYIKTEIPVPVDEDVKYACARFKYCGE